MEDEQFFHELFQLFGGPKPAALSAGFLLLIKVLALAFRWKLGEYVGLWRLTIVSGLTLVSVFFVQYTSGIPITGAIMNGTFMAALSVFVNQIYRQWQNYRKDKLIKSLPMQQPTVDDLMKRKP